MFKTRTHSQIRNSGGVLNLYGIKPVRTDKADRLEALHECHCNMAHLKQEADLYHAVCDNCWQMVNK